MVNVAAKWIIARTVLILKNVKNAKVAIPYILTDSVEYAHSSTTVPTRVVSRTFTDAGLLKLQRRRHRSLFTITKIQPAGKNKATLNAIAASNNIGRNHQPAARAARRISQTVTDVNLMERVA